MYNVKYLQLVARTTRRNLGHPIKPLGMHSKCRGKLDLRLNYHTVVMLKLVVECLHA